MSYLLPEPQSQMCYICGNTNNIYVHHDVIGCFRCRQRMPRAVEDITPRQVTLLLQRIRDLTGEIGRLKEERSLTKL